MKMLAITIRAAGAPPLVTRGKVETVRDLSRLFTKASANVRGTDRFLRGFSAGKVQTVTIREE